MLTVFFDCDVWCVIGRLRGMVCYWQFIPRGQTENQELSMAVLWCLQESVQKKLLKQ
jgi:hypothetical protein